MFNDFVPPRDQDLDAFGLNFDTLITAAPTDYGLVAGDATAFHTLRLAYTNALAAATDPSTRTKPTVAAKVTARTNVVASLRMLAAQIQAFPAITPDLLAGLGLTVRDTTRTKIPAPTTSPLLNINAIGSLSAQLRFADETSPASRRKPFGAIALRVGLKYGDAAPATIDDCTTFVQCTKNPVQLSYDAAQAGHKVWIVGQWQTRRGLTGPQSTPISSTVAA